MTKIIVAVSSNPPNFDPADSRYFRRKQERIPTISLTLQSIILNSGISLTPQFTCPAFDVIAVNKNLTPNP
ncbi:MAG: hypothetical protein KAT41_05335 [Candidatus Marinimicrobia bacterium]|nr:hypothetical protein [Candidatus Neomarinimicrobiota bacterium]